MECVDCGSAAISERRDRTAQGLRRFRCRACGRSEIMAVRGIQVSQEAVRDWETKLLPVMGDALRKRRHGRRRGPGTSWYVDQT
jgi:putative transposase